MVIGIVGYALLILEGIGIGLLFGPSWPDGISLMLVWYGLYYGVLGRDLAEVAGDRMVRTSASAADILGVFDSQQWSACLIRSWSH